MSDQDDPARQQRSTSGLGRWHPFAPSCTSSLEAMWCDRRDSDGMFVLQGSARELLGWTAEELAVVPACQLVHPDDRRLLTASVVRATGGVVPFLPIDVRLLSRDSRYWWTRWHLTQRPDGTSVAAGQSLLRPADDTGPAIGVWEWNADSDTIRWSAELLDMFGFRQEPPASYERALDVVLAEDRMMVARTVDAALQHGESFVVTFRSAAAGRRDRWFHASGRRCDQRGERRLAGVVKDLNPACGPHAARRAIGCG